MKTINALAVDYGAGGGKAVLGRFDGSRLVFEETHRFGNSPCRVLNNVYWNIFSLFEELKAAISRSVNIAGSVTSLGIDAWATDYGLLDSNGDLLGNPHSYLDDRTLAVTDEVFGAYSEYELFLKTGIEPHYRFGLFQLLASRRSDVYEKAKTALFIPGLLGYFCTGERHCEHTQASTTLMYDPLYRGWSGEIFDRFGLSNIFPGLSGGCSVLGNINGAVKNDTGAGDIQVMNVPQHDSAAAMLSAPISSGDTVFINCGSWSVVGTYLDAPLLTREVFEKKFNNQIGYNERIMFVKNILGLWIWQQCVREWKGYTPDYDELEREAAVIRFDPYIDLNKNWLLGDGSMCARIAANCAERGMETPKNKAQFYTCVLNGLAMVYKQSISDLSEITKKTYRRIHMVGGGAKSGYLCNRTAAETGLEVAAGSYEATAAGNIIAQLIAHKELKSEGEADQLIKNSL